MAEANPHADGGDFITPQVQPKKKCGRPKGRNKKKVYTRRKPHNSGNSRKYSRKDCRVNNEEALTDGNIQEEEATLDDLPPLEDVTPCSDDDDSEDDDTFPILRGGVKVDYAESDEDEDSILDNDDFTPDQLESLSRGELDTDIQRPRDKNGRILLSAEEQRSRRMCIYHYFKTLYRCMPEESGWWNGRNGIAARIAKKMELPPTTNLRPIKNTMRVILRYIEMGVEYTGQYAPRPEWGDYLIPRDSYQSQLVADFIEWDFGFTETTNFLNLYREEQGLTHVGRSCVYDAVKRMQPVVTKIGKRQQGSYDPQSYWAIANYRWSVQVLLRMKVITVDEIPMDLWEPKDGPLPDCFNPEKLTPIDPKFIAYWDETHKKQRMGKIKNGDNIQYRFKRNADGKVTMDGQLEDPGEEYKMKYEQEARMCTGCVLELDADDEPKKDENGRFLGRTLPMFNYSMKNIVTNKDYIKMFKITVREPHSIPKDKAGGWIESTRKIGEVFKTDDISQVKGIGKKSKCRAALAEWGVNTVQEFYDCFYMKPQKRHNFAKGVKGVSANKVAKWVDVCGAATEGEPTTIDHRSSDKTNPWHSRYGGDEWKKKVMEHPNMTKIVNIRTMVTHMFNESAEYYKGTKYEDTWMLWHDALSLMTAEDTVQWMKEKGYHKHWILPENGLNDNVKYFKRQRPPGCNPGGMPWDSSMNKYHDDVVWRHVAATHFLPFKDKKKFSLATPEDIYHAYSRVYDKGIPAHLIGHDILKTIDYWKMVMANHGLNCNKYIDGHRNKRARTEETKPQRGGKRVKNEDFEKKYLHEDAKDAMAKFFETEHRFKVKLEEIKKSAPIYKGIHQACMDPDSVEREDYKESLGAALAMEE